MNDIKKKIDEIVDKVKNDKDFAKKFKENPIEAVESVIGVDLPDDKINEIVTAVKTKINIDDSGIIGKVTGLFK
jgi:predicted RNA-binding protein with EMAP domain